MKSLAYSRLVALLANQKSQEFKPFIFYFLFRSLLGSYSKGPDSNVINKIQVCFFHPEVKAKVIQLIWMDDLKIFIFICRYYYVIKYLCVNILWNVPNHCLFYWILRKVYSKNLSVMNKILSSLELYLIIEIIEDYSKNLSVISTFCTWKYYIF